MYFKVVFLTIIGFLGAFFLDYLNKTSVGGLLFPVAILFTFIPEGFNLFFNIRFNKKFMEEFSKMFCHHDEHIEEISSPKRFNALKKRVSSFIGIKEIKSKSSMQREVSSHIEIPDVPEIVYESESLKFIPSLRKRVSSFAVFMRKYSFPLQAQSLDLTKLQSKNSVCADIKRRFSLFPTKSCNNIGKLFTKHRRFSLLNAI